MALGLLGYFKYLNFFVNNINMLTRGQLLSPRDIVLPIGISFYIQALSYVIDLYRGETKVQNSIFKLTLYVSFFPQLIAGPIVKYRDIEDQIDSRMISTKKLRWAFNGLL